MRLEVLPAAKGDCLLLHHGSEIAPKLIVIDGGPGGTYTDSLKPRLLEIRDQRIASGQIEDRDKLFIDLVIISHIDDDHINGILALLGDIADNDAPFLIGRLWHNGFDSLLDARSGAAGAVVMPASEVTAAVGGGGDLSAITGVSDDDDTDQRDLAKILASVPQGHAVLGLARRLGLAVNPDFDGPVIEATTGQPFALDELSITVLGPLKAELDALREAFAEWLRKKAAGQATPASLLASFTDKSVANLSSIVLLVDDGGQRFLLTGDARGDNIIEAVEHFGLLDAAGTLPVELFKVPHHGSDRNNDVRSFAMFPAAHYVFSGNGEHGNPERRAFEDLATALPAAEVTVELTYAPDEIDREREIEMNKKHARKPALPRFDAAEHGITAFFAAHPNVRVQHP